MILTAVLSNLAAEAATQDPLALGLVVIVPSLSTIMIGPELPPISFPK